MEHSNAVSVTIRENCLDRNKRETNKIGVASGQPVQTSILSKCPPDNTCSDCDSHSTGTGSDSRRSMTPTGPISASERSDSEGLDTPPLGTSDSQNETISFGVHALILLTRDPEVDDWVQARRDDRRRRAKKLDHEDKKRMAKIIEHEGSTGKQDMP